MITGLPNHHPRGIMRGTPYTARAQRRLATLRRWLIALLCIAAVGIAGRMDMDDEIVAEQMRADLERAAATVRAGDGCRPLGHRKAHTPEQVARQCTTSERGEQ